jgi:DNA-binding CsgD family transcriptional regulator
MSALEELAGEDGCIALFLSFLDALYPAALGEGPWSPALTSLLALGAREGSHRRLLFAAALRHVEHAFAINRRLGSDVQHAAVLECAAGSLPCGVLLLDARASVLFASSRATALLRGRPGIFMEQGRLRSLRGLEDRTLMRCLARLLGAGGESAALCVDVPGQARPGAVRLLLMRAGAQGTGPAAVLALAFEQNPPDALPGRDLLREIYGLSPAEAELASLLLAGQSLGEAARSRSVSMNTARSQLKLVLRKTGSRNQSDLMRTLIAGPAGLLHGMMPGDSSAAR